MNASKSKQNPEEIDVVVLCGGLGTRLRSVVANNPKPMADVNGQPFLAHIMDYLTGAGFVHFVLGCGYKAEAVRSYFEIWEKKVSIEYSLEKIPLGTGGAVKNALPFLRSNPVLVLNGDSFCRVDYDGLLATHAQTSASITMAVSRMASRADYGQIELGDSDRVLGFREKGMNTEGGWINAGVYVFDKRVIEQMPDSIPLSLEKDVFPAWIGGDFRAFRTEEPVYDIGTPERYELARKTFAASRKGE
jgi:NDP-sugar pyrophosphorylase family protein